MSRAGRLFDVIQLLRRRRGPTTAAELAGELGVSVRTLYRDVAALVARGVPIRGEPGVGYILDPRYFLTFGTNELDAVLLGLKWVEKRADPGMARAAVDAMAKIEAVLLVRVAEGISVFPPGSDHQRRRGRQISRKKGRAVAALPAADCGRAAPC